jgi:hypothetical protein
LPAQAQNQYLPTREVLIFPNNVAFIAKEGNLAFRNRRAVLADRPNALNGTFWLKPGGNFKITKTEFGQDTLWRLVEARTFFDVLRANAGAQAMVTYQIGTEIEDVRGTILPFIAGSNLARIRTTTGATKFISEDQVRQVSVEGGAAETHFQQPYLGDATIIEIDKPLALAPVRLFYYTQGFTWFPSYVVRIVTDSTIQFSLKAVLENQAEPLTNAHVKFVMGQSNIRTGQPMTEQTARLLEFLQAPAEGVVQARQPNADSTRRDSVTAPTPAPPGNEDLMVYDVGNISLGMGSRAEVPVFERTLAAQRLYVAHVPICVDSTTGEPLPRDGMIYTARVGLRLANDQLQPLLPGDVLLLDRNERPLGQHSLPPLRPGQSTELTYAPAPEVRVLLTNRVQERRPCAARNGRQCLDQITVRGSIRVENLSGEFRTIEVSHIVPGNITRASTGTVSPAPGSLQGNSLKRITWAAPVQSQGVQIYPYEFVYTVPVP